MIGSSPGAAPPATIVLSDSGAHLRAELARLELILRRELARTAGPADRPGPLPEFVGLYVSRDEMKAFVDGVAPSAPGGDGTHAVRVRESRAEIDRAVARALASGTDLRLPRLARRFGLTGVEVRLLLWCLAPDIDVRFHRCFGFLQDDASRKRPSIQLLARLSEGVDDVLDVARLLGPAAPLVANRLVTLPPRGRGGAPPLATQEPVVPSQVVDFLHGQDHVDESLAPFVRLVRPRSLPSWGGYGAHHARVLGLLHRAERGGSRRPSYIAGPPGAGRSRLVERMALDTGRQVLRVDASGLVARSERLEDDLHTLARDARLHDAVVHFIGIDDLAGEEEGRSPRREVLNAWLREVEDVPRFLSGTRPVAEMVSKFTTPLSGYELPYPTLEERSELWTQILQGPSDGGALALIDDLAAKFRFTPGQIRDAARAAGARAGEDGVVPVAELHRSCREHSNQRLLLLTRKLEPRYGWSDIVIPDEVRSQLQEICSSVRQRRTVYATWGFENKFSVGNGLVVLFSGPSGTGKTMSAEIIAGDLGLDAYKIDLSGVVSKYVGETERNLARIFDEAETSNSILFFDEADALFGKRSEVKDAHDRYANIEVNYLLQKLDEYAGIVILATNFKGNMDAAFTRRLTHAVDFPAPDEELRLGIWKGMFPAGAPIAEDVDFGFLARQFTLSGGHIKNVALNSAFMAAQDGGPVRMAHVIRATKREYDKLGKLSSKSEFGPYMKLVRPVSGA